MSTIVSIMSIVVFGVSTAAWFQLDSQPLQTSMVSGTGNVSLVNNSTYGYKITPALGGNGKINYSNTTVTKKNGSTISTTNNNLEGSDTNFDVPDQGIGYYLIEQNSENTFKYKYNDVVMATKFVSKTGGSVNTHYIASKTLAAKTYRIKKYTFVNNETVYEQVPIKTTNSTQITLNNTGNNPTYDITINSAGTYKIWLNYSSATDKWDLSLEATSYSPNAANHASLVQDSKKPEEVKARRNTAMPSPTSGNKLIYCTAANSWSSVYIHYWGGSSSSTWGSNPTMTYLYTNDQQQKVYYYNVPSGTTGLIFKNAVGDTDWKTGDITISGKEAKAFAITNNTGSYSTWTFSTSTYYFVNSFYANSVKSFGTPYVYAFTKRAGINSGNAVQTFEGENWPGFAMTSVGNDIWKVVLPASSYRQLVFTTSTGDKQTTDIESCTADSYYMITGYSNNKYTGTWTSSPNVSTYTYKLYDVNNVFGGAPYAYFWEEDNSHYAWPGWQGKQMSTTGTSRLYTITVSQSYNRVIFNSSDSIKTGNITVGSTYNNKTYVMTALDAGDWYNAVDTTAIDNVNKTTYYIYDKTNKFGGSAPYAYGYRANTPGLSNTYYTNYEGTTWPGNITSNSPIPGGSTNITGLYSVSLSNSYDHIIFNNGTRNVQTDDASAALVANSPIFVLDGGEVTEAGITKYTGSWQSSLAAITMNLLFFTYDGSSYTRLDTTNISGVSADYGRGATYNNGTFDPGNVSSQDGKDAINGILYHFEPEATYWYTSETTFNDSTKFTPNSTQLSSGAHTLYKRMICDMTAMKTIYVDASHSGTGADDTYWQNISVCGSGGSDTPYFSSNDSGANWKIGTNLYRFTVPTSYTIRIANSGYSSSGGNNTTSNFLVSSLSTSNFIVINTASSGVNCSITQCTDVATSIGTATIRIDENNDGTFEHSEVMQIGDLSSNDFMLEQGVRIKAGSYVYVDVVESDGNTTNYYHYDEYVDTKPTYIKKETSTGYGNIEMTSYTGYARFNFYLTHNNTPSSRKLSIAMVPDYGNGYYIMPYDEDLTTTTFSGAIKMSMGSNESASYDGFYASAGQEIFIRSYLDAVDVLYKRGNITGVNQTGVSSGCVNLYGVVANHTDVQLNTTTGVIKFGSSATGYYDIDVYNGVITITKYEIGDFFKLNALNTSSVKTEANIKNQITTLVIEVQFTCNNAYASKMTLTADNDMSDFIGAALYCTTTGNKLSDPYNYLRANCYGDISSTNNVIKDSNTSFTVPANSAATYYAYIIIDYIPTDNGGDYTDFLSDYNGDLYFYLNAVQYLV